MEAKPTFIIKDYNDPKLWAALEELDKKEGRAWDFFNLTENSYRKLCSK